MDKNRLIENAKSAATHAYAPYSHFRVGAALLCDDGTVITGANVENRSYGLSNCAERSAIFQAISLGHRNFSAIAVHSPDCDYPVSPCGACRQVLTEFLSPATPVILVGRNGEAVELELRALLPHDALHELKSKDQSG